MAKLEVKAVYVRSATIEKREISKVVKSLKKINCKTIFPIALDGTVAYFDSKLRPTQFSDWDPLKEIIKIAHNEGIEVYPWVCVFLTESERDVQKKGSWINPDWLCMNKEGEKIDFLDPGKPEVRKFAINSLKEIAKNYAIDGISIDYLRYGKDCYCPYCRKEFKKEYGKDPLKFEENDSLLPYWHEWMEGNVTQTLKEAVRELKKINPQIKFSSYFWSWEGAYRVHQNWPSWIKEGYLDWANPTGYIYHWGEFRKQCKHYVDIIKRECPTYITIGVETSHGKLKNYEEINRQMKTAEEEGMDGVVFFTYQAIIPYLDYLK